MSILNSGNVGRVASNRLIKERSEIAKVWSDMGLLEGLSDGIVKDNITQLYENQASQMLKESTDANGSNGSFETVAFPIVRRVYSNLLANEIVTVQALSLPIGKLYYFNPKISTGHTAYDGAYQNAVGNSNKTAFEDRSLYDAFYHQTDANGNKTSLFDRSKGKATIVKVTSGMTLVGNKLTITGFTSTANQGKLITAEGHTIDTESFLSSLVVRVGATEATAVPVEFSLSRQVWGKGIVDANGTINLQLQLESYNPATSAMTPIDTTFKEVTYKTYAELEQNSEMAEITFGLTEVVLATKTRKMRANWTPELAQDVMAFQNIDAEVELTNMLSETIASEIDREILEDLRKGAAFTKTWDYNGLKNGAVGQNFFGTQKDYNQTLITKINQVTAQIHKATLKNGSTWLVVSPEVSAVLDDLEYFHVSSASPEENRYNLGIEKVGTLSGRYTVYKDNYAPHDIILIGSKGSSILDTGYVYAPYVPLQLTPVMIDQRDFTSVRGIMTRYAKKMVNNSYYGKVIVLGLGKFDMGF